MKVIERGSGEYGADLNQGLRVYPKWAKTPCRDAMMRGPKRAMWRVTTRLEAVSVELFCRKSELPALPIQGDRMNYAVLGNGARRCAKAVPNGRTTTRD